MSTAIPKIESRKLSSISLIVFSVACMLGFAFLATLLIVENAKSSCVDYSECNATQSTFGLLPGYNATTLNTCKNVLGNRRGLCSFRVSNLKEAHDLCNINSEVCSRFTYFPPNSNSTKGIVNFVSLKAKLNRNVNSNIYTRQSGVTYTPGYIKPQTYEVEPLTNTLNASFFVKDLAPTTVTLGNYV